MPFFLVDDSDEDAPTYTLLRLGFEAVGQASDPDALDGLSGLFALAVILLLLWALLQIGAVLALWGRSLGRTAFRICRFITVVQVVACVAGWLMVWSFAANVDDVSGFSPALLVLTAGAIVGVALTGPGKDWMQIR
jgi:hypothetical protein